MLDFADGILTTQLIGLYLPWDRGAGGGGL